MEAFHSPSRNNRSLYLSACLDLVFLCPWFLQGPIQGLQTICCCSFKTCSWVFPFRVISFLIFGCGSSYHPNCTFPHLSYITCPILNWSTPSLTLSHHISPKMQVISYKTTWCCNPQAHNLKHIKLTLVFVNNSTSKLSKWLRTHFQIMPTLIMLPKYITSYEILWATAFQKQGHVPGIFNTNNILSWFSWHIQISFNEESRHWKTGKYIKPL